MSAAEGWLMLGNPHEANQELEQVSSENRYHPLVLAARWQVYAMAGWWEAALVVSKALCSIAPDRSYSWICQANALRSFHGFTEARKLLMSVVGKFPDDPIIAYNLACFSCQLGLLNDACTWLLRAFQHENSTQLKVMALVDPDLGPLWEKIGTTTPSCSNAVTE
jgi:predicted Zn-dependent protease